MDATAEIRARLPIEELVAQYCQVQRKGRTLKALCPFHNDTHPSLTISPDKGIAYCFACQTGGDIFSFYQAIEGVDFPQALRDLAEKTGVELPRRSEYAPVPKKDERERLRKCLEAARTFYRSELLNNGTAQTYVNERQVTQDLQETFEIGFAPDSFDATYTRLLKEGFSRSEILGAGLGVQKELKEEKIYDRFRNRIMFPIRDHKGDLIGFGGRALGEADAKYINSPDGHLYNKSTVLFGFNLAKEAIRKQKNVTLVEGYFDVIACRRIGIENAVAVSGTALTEQHVQIMKRNAERVLLCLDQDAAGRQAAERAFQLCAREDLDVRILLLPQGKDPDECAKLAPEEFIEESMKGGTPYLDAVLDELRKENVEKRPALRRLIPLLNAIPSSVERKDAIRKSAEFLRTTEMALEEDLRSFAEPPPSENNTDTRIAKSPFNASELLIGLLLTYGKHLSLIEHVIPPEDEPEKELYNYARSTYTDLPGGEESRDLSKSSKERIAVLQLYCEEHFGQWSDALALQEIKKLCRTVNMAFLRKKQQQLIGELKAARTGGKKLEEEKLLTRYQQVLKLQQLAL